MTKTRHLTTPLVAREDMYGTVIHLPLDTAVDQLVSDAAGMDAQSLAVRLLSHEVIRVNRKAYYIGRD